MDARGHDCEEVTALAPELPVLELEPDPEEPVLELEPELVEPVEEVDLVVPLLVVLAAVPLLPLEPLPLVLATVLAPALVLAVWRASAGS
jgi:hypothetical protein